MTKRLINPKEAAGMLSVTTDCLRKWESAGKIKAIRTVGGQRRYELQDIEKLLRGDEEQTGLEDQ
jgi:excisionase family DNA binding protein